MTPIEPGTRYGKRVVFGEERILRKTNKIRGLWMRCDCGREDLVDRYQVTRGLASQCLDCQKVEQSLRMEAKWAKRKGELMGKVLIEREMLESLLDDPRLVVVMKSEQVYGIKEAAAQPAEAEGVELVPFWVLFDATTPEPLIKKHMPEGVLAFFDNEEDARRAKALHPGTDYKRAPYVRAAALSAVTAERDRLRALIAECAEYLNTDRETTIGSGSILHRQMIATLAAKDRP